MPHRSAMRTQIPSDFPCNNRFGNRDLFIAILSNPSEETFDRFIAEGVIPKPKKMRGSEALWLEDDMNDVLANFPNPELPDPTIDDPTVTDEERWLINELNAGDWLDACPHVCEIETLHERDPEYKRIWEDHYLWNHEKNRERLALLVLRRWPGLPVQGLAYCLVRNEKSCGEIWYKDPDYSYRVWDYDFLTIARIWLKHSKVRRAELLLQEFRPTEYLINKIIPQASVGILFGPPNDGKSFLSLNLANAVRQGRDWFGLPTRKSDVLYMYGEGHAGIQTRLKALYQVSSIDGGDIAIHNGIPTESSGGR